MNHLTSFHLDGKDFAVEYIETVAVAAGVSCDAYRFAGDDSRDLAIVTVEAGHHTPLQRVLSGDETIEGFLAGAGELMIRPTHGAPIIYQFADATPGDPVIVAIDELMQWTATTDRDLLFYEVCAPPYRDGRFENLPE